MKSSRLIPCLAIAWMLGAQITPPPPDAAQGPSHSASEHHDPTYDPMLEEQTARMAGKRNSQRQQQVIADTARLVQLSLELKAEVDKSTKNELSLTVVKKAEEIEKLAKAVKVQMRDGY